MDLPLHPLLLWALLAFGLCYGSLYLYFTWNYDYWKKRSVPHEKPIFPFGNMWKLVLSKESMVEFYQNIYARFKGHRYMGSLMLREPTLMVHDPALIKQICIKDFSHFHDRGFPVDEVNDPMSGNLFNLQGLRWHSLRNKLSPTFTSGKMKYMFPIVRACAEQLKETTSRELEKSEEGLELKDLMARYTTDIIGSAAFGVEPGALKNPDSEFRLIGRRVFASTIANAIRLVMVIFAPKLSVKLKMRNTDIVADEYFTKIVKETVDYREKNNVKRADFLQLLLGLRAGIQEDGTTGSPDTELTMPQLTAQCFVFFLGGFETSATTLTFTLYELSRNLDVQRQLREEVDRVLEEHGGELTYEGLAQMHLMDRVISETLRKYPAVPMLVRECTKEWTIPAADESDSDAQKWSKETRDGGVVIEVGTKVHIPIIGFQNDPQYFPDPDRFDPDRFTEEGRKNWPQFAYVPFGEGPRICIGMRFGNMQTKAGLSALLSKFEFRLSPKTPSPLKMDKYTLIPTVEGGMWLKVIERPSM